jgi:aminocarboxymuconate-semialdehyde decarboxylase
MFFDTLTFDTVTLRMLAEQVGWDQIVVGSDYPMTMESPEPVRIVQDSRLPKSVERRVLAENAQRFMRKVN